MNNQMFKLSCTKVKMLAAAASVLLCMSAHAADLVNNGSFETGNFAGWQTSAAGAGGGAELSLFGVDGNGPHDGTYSAYFGALAPYDTISQTLATSAGTVYQVSFDLDSTGTEGTSAGFVGTFGASTFINLSGSDPNQSFSPETFLVTATSPSTVLSFAAYNTGSFYTLDDVSVQAVAVAAVPEPSTYALFSVGLAMFGVARARARRK